MSRISDPSGQPDSTVSTRRRGRRRLAAGALAAALASSVAGIATADPPATFEIDDPTPVRGQAVTFTATDACVAPVTCTWSGDGGLSGEGRRLPHAYTELGPKLVTLTIDDPSLGSGEPQTHTELIEVVNRPPTVSFTRVVDGLEVTFTALASDADRDALRYAWDFGDGTRSTESDPRHAYAAPGRYEVQLAVTDGNGPSVTANATIAVNNLPQSEVTAVPPAPLTNEPVTFAVTGADPDGGVLQYEWDVDGDGAFDDGFGASVGPVTYASPEARTVRVRVTDQNQGQVVETITVPIRNRPPIADFGFSPSAAERGRPVVFTSRASDPEQGELDQTWDLDGDGEYDDAFGPSVTHTFNGRGAHVVGLRVRDAHGDVTVMRLPVVFGNRAPVAAFTFTPERPVAGQTVELTSQSSDPDGAISALAWDLDGDGAFDDATGPRASLKVAGAGPVSIGLRVVDEDGAVAVTSRALEVTGKQAVQPVPTRTTKLLKPFPTIRVAGRLTRSGAVFRLVSVRAPRGSRVSWSCSSRRCGGSRRATSGRTMRLRALERSFRAGTVLEFRVTRSARVGKYTRIQVRRNRAPGRRDLCVRRASDRPIACPS
ncbi:MAG: CBM44 [uncultured Solirubrobacteraceae bacterium]|uniref:CBM44 n=1 Tax=uncultured Solirubrobacteraceae bacterium TaxID=1162706 RepID=A0A6J4S6K1_9ACTN|nr:MAG: CBM44 [uncultured Solirubrobacteraceae bacterium]